jgi:hypothetical protein
LGCLIAFLIWLGAMAFPCAFVTLLVEKELVFSLSALPEHQVRLFLLDSPEERGLGLARPEIVSGGEAEGAYCIRIRVRYLMWVGEAQAVDYCDCYEKINGEWSPTLIGGDKNCQPQEFSEP